MRRFALLLALAAGLLAFPAGASAGTTLVTQDGAPRPQPFQSWVDRAAVPTPPGVVTVALRACPGGPAWGAACADPLARTVYLGPEGRDPVTVLHELGHLFDALVLDDRDRAGFRSLMHRRSAWIAAASTNPLHEQFAEAYALCARHPRLRATRLAMYGYIATPRRHARVCGFIRAAAARHALR
jgi:hypothetical protein